MGRHECVSFASETDLGSGRIEVGRPLLELQVVDAELLLSHAARLLRLRVHRTRQALLAVVFPDLRCQNRHTSRARSCGAAEKTRGRVGGGNGEGKWVGCLGMNGFASKQREIHAAGCIRGEGGEGGRRCAPRSREGTSRGICRRKRTGCCAAA